MARFTIELPAELAGDGTAGERAAANVRNRSHEARTDDRGADAATRRFVSWVECWADA